MTTLIRIVSIIAISVISAQLNAQDRYHITVNVEGASSNDGKIFLALYKVKANFLKQPFKDLKSEISNEGCEVTFEDLPAGIYAVSIFHDENNNGKMDTNFMGIPREDYGCSNGAKGFMGPPKWEDAKFELKENKSIRITL